MTRVNNDLKNINSDNDTDSHNDNDSAYDNDYDNDATTRLRYLMQSLFDSSNNNNNNNNNEDNNSNNDCDIFEEEEEEDEDIKQIKDDLILGCNTNDINLVLKSLTNIKKDEKYKNIINCCDTSEVENGISPLALASKKRIYSYCKIIINF
jgi:hypothetical protein